MLLKRFMILCALVMPTPALTLEIERIQGGCEPAAVRKLVRQSQAKLERCGATGPVVIRVAPDGHVVRVRAEMPARTCLRARTATWQVRMRERAPCVVELATRVAAPHGH